MGKEKTEKTGILAPQKKQNSSNKRKIVAKILALRTKKKQDYGYQPTNIGMTFDAEYHRNKKVNYYWKQYYGEEENLDLKEVIKDL